MLTLAERVQQFNEDAANADEPTLTIHKLRMMYSDAKIKNKRLRRNPGNPNRYTP